jgi:hypothetical protein
MAEKKWENQLMDFIKRTGEELKRTGEDIKVEAQRLMDEVRDPSRQAKVKETLKDLRDKATAMTKEAGELLESAVKKVEGAFEQDKSEDGPQAQPASAPTPAEPAPASKPARKAGKTIGKKAGAKKAGAKKAAGTKAPAAKKAAPKSIGRKKPKA